jgi:hypothetical protein
MPLATRWIGPSLPLPLGRLPAMYFVQAFRLSAVALVVSSRPKPPPAPLAKTPPPSPPPPSDANCCDKAPGCGAVACRSAGLVGMLRTSHGRSRLPGATRGGCLLSSSGTLPLLHSPSPLAARRLLWGEPCLRRRRKETRKGRPWPPPGREFASRRKPGRRRTRCFLALKDTKAGDLRALLEAGTLRRRAKETKRSTTPTRQLGLASPLARNRGHLQARSHLYHNRRTAGPDLGKKSCCNPGKSVYPPSAVLRAELPRHCTRYRFRARQCHSS